MEGQVVDGLRLVLTDRASGLVASVQSLFSQARGGLLTLAAGSALVSLSGAFAVAVGALNLAYDVDEHRTWLRRRLVGLVMALGTLVLVVVALAVLVVGPLLGRGAALADALGLGRAYVVSWDLLRLPALAVVLVGWLATLFHYAPNRRTTWRRSLPGAVLTAMLWVGASAGLRVYLEVAAGGNPVLGAFGGAALLMTWAYLLSVALLLGGELNGVLLDRRHLGTGSAGRQHVGTGPPGDDVPDGQLELFGSG